MAKILVHELLKNSFHTVLKSKSFEKKSTSYVIAKILVHELLKNGFHTGFGIKSR